MEKIAVAKFASQLIEDGMVIGVGSGSTVAWFLYFMSKRLSREGIRVRCVVASSQIEALAKAYAIPILDDPVSGLDLSIDGADEVDPALNLLKGMGGALTREKMIAQISNRYVVICDSSKLVPRLFSKHPLPVEVIPFMWKVTARRVARECHAMRYSIRMLGAKPYITDNGNYLIEMHEVSASPDAIVSSVKNIAGVVECGVFPKDLVTEVITAHGTKVTRLSKAK